MRDDEYMLDFDRINQQNPYFGRRPSALEQMIRAKTYRKPTQIEEPTESVEEVPAEEESNTKKKYKVQKGDTLWDLSRATGIPIADLRAQLGDNKFNVGAELDLDEDAVNNYYKKRKINRANRWKKKPKKVDPDFTNFVAPERIPTKQVNPTDLAPKITIDIPDISVRR